MTAPRSHRRDFLKGKAAVEAVSQILDEAADGVRESLPATSPEHYLLKFSRRAMACQFEVWLNVGQYPHAAQHAVEALDLVEHLEGQLTVYRDSSEVSRLNQLARWVGVPVEPRLYQLLRESVRLWQITSGAFDITAGPLSELWGFTRRAGRVPAESEIAAALSRVGSQFLDFDDEAGSVRFLQEGMEINLGGIGKGYALDRCAELFASLDVGDYLFHGGNSSVLGRGSSAGQSTGGWLVGVRNPLRPEHYLGQLVLRDRALSTSGSFSQSFIHQGRRYGHLLDPRTGWPADGVLAATVLAPTAAEAEAFSTAFYVLGAEEAEVQCQALPEIACLMICPGERAGAITVHTFNLPAETWHPAGPTAEQQV